MALKIVGMYATGPESVGNFVSEEQLNCSGPSGILYMLYRVSSPLKNTILYYLYFIAPNPGEIWVILGSHPLKLQLSAAKFWSSSSLNPGQYQWQHF